MTEVLEAIGRAVNEAADKVGPSVVGLGRGWGRGSGVVIAPGQVVTVAHVLRGDEVAVAFPDGDVREGRVLGSDPDLDVAVIGVDTGDAPAVAWAEDGAATGAPVFALANPGGRGLRTTFGLVSATGRGFRGPRGRRVAGSIEHTAPLPRGSSGGPLTDLAGNLIALNAVRRDGGFILASATACSCATWSATAPRRPPGCSAATCSCAPATSRWRAWTTCSTRSTAAAIRSPSESCAEPRSATSRSRCSTSVREVLRYP